MKEMSQKDKTPASHVRTLWENGQYKLVFLWPSPVGGQEADRCMIWVPKHIGTAAAGLLGPVFCPAPAAPRRTHRTHLLSCGPAGNANIVSDCEHIYPRKYFLTHKNPPFWGKGWESTNGWVMSEFVCFPLRIRSQQMSWLSGFAGVLLKTA